MVESSRVPSGGPLGAPVAQPGHVVDWERVRGGGATNVTPVTVDEFGTPAFSCVAPDG